MKKNIWRYQRWNQKP